MAYEVTKRIGGRAYRYRVESVRDPETGKRRSRWTYLGRGDGAEKRPAAPRPRGDARERLLDALERLVAERDFATITADAIATEAGLAHGTFYRHFRDKREALLAALQRVRERIGPRISALRDDVTTVAEARAGIRAMLEAILRSPGEQRALWRAYQALALRDPALGAEINERRKTATERIGDHLEALRQRGLATVEDPRAAGAALFAMIDGFYREAMVDGVPPDEARIAAAVAVADRAVFGEIARIEP
jgi:AcrR family transcriptional regulator